MIRDGSKESRILFFLADDSVIMLVRLRNFMDGVGGRITG